MADEGNGLLAHLTLSGWFTNSIEPIATQSLAYILARSASARRAVQETVLAGGADVGTLESVWPEAVGQDGGIPDVACYDRDCVARVLIENKFWAELTQHQPETYLNRLPKDDQSCALLFVAPEERISTLWPEVCKRAGASATPDADTSAPQPVGVEKLRVVGVEPAIARLGGLVSGVDAGDGSQQQSGVPDSSRHRPDRILVMRDRDDS